MKVPHTNLQNSEACRNLNFWLFSNGDNSSHDPTLCFTPPLVIVLTDTFLNAVLFFFLTVPV